MAVFPLSVKLDQNLSCIYQIYLQTYSRCHRGEQGGQTRLLHCV